MVNWQPCIAEDEYSHYKKILTVIDRQVYNKLQEPFSYDNIGIMDGYAGELLYLFYSSIHNNNQDVYDFALSKVEELLEIVDANSSYSLCSGLAGIIWALQHLENNDMVPGAGNMIDDDVIDHLCEISVRLIEGGNYDYMHAGLGICLPLLSSEKIATQYSAHLEKIVDVLDSDAHKENNMAYWLYKIDIAENKGPSVSLGLSHGLPGIIAILSKISNKGIAVNKCNQLAEQIINYIFHTKNTRSDSPLYPSLVYIGDKEWSWEGNGRVAWCYGDLNIAIALLYAAKAQNKPDYRQIAIDIIEQTIKRRDTEYDLVADGSFCHGTVGVGHLYSRFYNYTQNETFKEAANFWFAKTLEKIKYEDNVYKIYRFHKGVEEWTTNTDVLMGSAGMGLAILSGIAPVMPLWDEVMLLDF